VHLLSVLAILTVITPYIALQIFDQFADVASRSRANMKPKTELRHATAARDNAKLKFINGAEAEHIDMDKSL
jgi:hypothetical protein